MIKNKCPATGKTIFLNQTIANETMVRIKSHNKLNKNKKSNGKSNQKRSYFCKWCNGYHLTSIVDFKLSIKKKKEINKKAIEFLNSIDYVNWKTDSIPFDFGHIPPAK